MKTHTLRLHAAPFEAIRSGRKTIESRLYDEKRQAIELGDELVFVSREDGTQIVTKVVRLLRYRTFHELFARNDLTKFGLGNLEQAETEIARFYSPEDQKANGVVGIEFEIYR